MPQEGSVSTIPAPPGYDVPPSPGFTPDRLGVRRVVIDVDRVTGVYRTSATPCPATAAAWGPADAPEVVCQDLLAELLALSDKNPKKLPALLAVQQLPAAFVTIFAAILSGREG